MNLDLAEQLATRLLAEHGLARQGWTFGFNHRKRALGLCEYEARRVALSVYFVMDNAEAEVRDVVLHEIAHALAGPRAGHGPKWVAACRRVGARPQRLNHTAEMPRGRYRAKCPGCGIEHHRHRRPMRGRTYCCRHCGPQAGRLRFVAVSGSVGTPPKATARPSAGVR